MPERPTRIIDLSPDDDALIQALLPWSVQAACINAPHWMPTLAHARIEIQRASGEQGVCRVLMDARQPCAWAAAAPCADSAWELHPLLVDPARHGHGYGRQLAADIEAHARAAGALTMDVSTSDGTGATTLHGADLFVDPLGALARIDVIDPVVGHAYRFWQSIGYALVGVLPDAEGVGVPSIRLAKSLRQAPTGHATGAASQRERAAG